MAQRQAQGFLGMSQVTLQKIKKNKIRRSLAL
jgi:hypothetical protein